MEMARISRPAAITVHRRDALVEGSGKWVLFENPFHCRQTVAELRARNGASTCAREPFGRTVISVMQCVEDELDARRDAEFFKDPEEVLLDGVFAERQFPGDLAIGESLGHEGDDLLLARSDQNVTVRVHNPEGWNLRNQIDEEIDLLGGGPNLAAVHNLNALAERAELRCGETEQAARSRTKSIYGEFTINRLEHEN